MSLAEPPSPTARPAIRPCANVRGMHSRPRGPTGMETMMPTISPLSTPNSIDGYLSVDRDNGLRPCVSRVIISSFRCSANSLRPAWSRPSKSMRMGVAIKENTARERMSNIRSSGSMSRMLPSRTALCASPQKRRNTSCPFWLVRKVLRMWVLLSGLSKNSFSRK